MSMNLLIVDDEYEILTWLEELFRYDFEPSVEVYTASSAYEAIDWLNRVNFDVVLTDIKMPGMDGLTLFQKIKANWPRCRTIFLTGYPNFEDVYQIIRHKDVRYILKSEDDEVIMKTVREVLEEQKAEAEQEILRQKREQDMGRVREWMRQDFLSAWLSGGYDGKEAEQLSQTAQEAGVHLDLRRPFLMLSARIDPKSAEDSGEEQSKALLEMIERSLRTSLSGDVLLEACTVSDRWAAGFLQMKGQGDAELKRLFALVKGALEYAQPFFEQLSRRSFSAAIESTPLGCGDVPGMFLRMKQLLRGALGGESAVVVHVETVNLPGEKSGMNDAGQVHLLKTHLELRQRREYFATLDAVCEEMLHCGALSDVRGLGLYYGVSIPLLQFIQENRMEDRLPKKISLERLTRMDENRSWPEAAQFLIDVSSAVFDLTGEGDSAISDRALGRICDYIDRYPEKDLSLTRLAEIGGFNASYLSRIFRQRKNITVTDYVTQKRMKLAALMLETTGEKIQTIAEKTGYLSSQSFARAFRNYYGVSAAEYRESHQKNL